MSARRRILGAAAGAVGLAAAGAAIGIRRQSRAIGRREGDATPFGSLHSRPMTIIGESSVKERFAGDRVPDGCPPLGSAPERTITVTGISCH